MPCLLSCASMRENASCLPASGRIGTLYAQMHGSLACAEAGDTKYYRLDDFKALAWLCCKVSFVWLTSCCIPGCGYFDKSIFSRPRLLLQDLSLKTCKVLHDGKGEMAVLSKLANSSQSKGRACTSCR